MPSGAPIAVSASGAQCQSLTTCASTLCGANTKCVENNGKPECVPLSSCSAVLCPPNLVCQENGKGQPECVKQTSCSNTNCGYGKRCVDNGKGAQCVAANTCATTLCPPSTTCFDTANGAECRKGGSNNPQNCASVTCQAGSMCTETSSGPRCMAVPTCRDVQCGSGKHCELKDVQCVRAPCPAATTGRTPRPPMQRSGPSASQRKTPPKD